MSGRGDRAEEPGPGADQTGVPGHGPAHRPRAAAPGRPQAGRITNRGCHQGEDDHSIKERPPPGLGPQDRAMTGATVPATVVVIPHKTLSP
ncbi:hypothetical protein ACFFX0_31535 [Citricoccus parietis]|uniref:Uncharacterized protein n=1 Tax=Citricoccus parietis TaxID=592307 RepID=A0ABV5G951_9MICC